tara:strand:+ start:983 stop:1207 length:225 start_codon:yes stop_codon:yes gene_type:complete
MVDIPALVTKYIIKSHELWFFTFLVKQNFNGRYGDTQWQKFRHLPFPSHAMQKLLSSYEFPSVLDIGSGQGVHA